ncbi:MAG: hypothetical protein MUC96_29590 [Myxococcaceae bacterium]|jgi:hypothetical protein|nr:hypothetical protein [Myxococcaceae bacterium]
MRDERTTRFLERLDRQRRTLAEEVEDDVAPLRGLSTEERGRVLASVCRDAMAILRARPDGEAVLSAPAERSRHWDELIARYRARGRD